MFFHIMGHYIAHSRRSTLAVEAICTDLLTANISHKSLLRSAYLQLMLNNKLNAREKFLSTCLPEIMTPTQDVTTKTL